MKNINIVIPCHNEEKNISLFYEEAKKYLGISKYNINYIYIDDGSQDKTKEEIMKLTEKEKDVKAYFLSRNFGKEAAIICGLDKSVNADATIVIDADLQMPISYIKDMLKYWEEGYKLVLTKKEKREKGVKNFLAKKFYTIFNKVSRTELIKDVLDFQLMDQEVVKVICSFRERKRFFKGITSYAGYKYKLIPVKINPRIEGDSDFNSFPTLFSYAFISIANNSTIFLNLSMILGLLFTIVGFIYVLFISLRQILYNISVSGWTSIVSLMLIFFGIVLIILGIIGYYIGLIYEELKQRPIYIIEEEMK